MKVPAKERANLPAFRLRWAAPDEKILLFVAAWCGRKGAQVLIDAIPRILTAYPKLKVIIVGGGGSSHLASQAAALGVASKVVFPGFVSEDDLRKLYAVADIAVFPSLYEPFGIVAIEAMATGTPVVTSDIGGFREVIRHNETGIHTWANNPDSLAWGILEVLRNPEQTRRRVQNALEDVRSRFSWNGIAQETLAVYRDVFSSK